MSDALMELSDDDRLTAIRTAFGRVAATEDGQAVFGMIAAVTGILAPDVQDERFTAEENRIRRNLGLELFQLLPDAMKQARKAFFLPAESQEKP
jgi:hypothetical protein